MATKRDLEQRLAPAKRIQTQTVSLQTTGGSVRAVLNKEALRHAGVDPDNPGTVETHYVRDKQWLVIDLGEATQDG